MKSLLSCVLLAALLATASSDAGASPSLDDYRHFRALSIDLLGRMPTRAEVAQLESPGFDLDAWIDAHLDGAPYADRLTRVYMDLLRLSVNPAVQFAPDATTLFRHAVLGPDGKPIYVYWRAHQRRAREATDGEFCLTPEETGQSVAAREAVKGEAKRVSKAVLDEYTVAVRPWWLYRDYLSVTPQRRYKMGWDDPDPQYQPVDSLLTEPDGKTPTTEIRVCREEAQPQEKGHIVVTGRKPPPPGATPPFERRHPLPLDTGYARQHPGELVSCQTKIGFDSSPECGCGVALERCIAYDSEQPSQSFYFPNHAPLGLEMPIDTARQTGTRWFPFWWSQEAVHFLDYLFTSDRDFREILTARYSVINGPLAQFYRTIQPTSCCGGEAQFGMASETEPLFSPQKVPDELFPHDVRTWRVVADRGAHAAGLLTTPIFLEKYASARARGAAIYNAFLCKSFVSENAELTPSTEPNLMVRSGCKNCHATLEPLAAYFARIEPGNLVYLPEQQFPVKNAKCKPPKPGARAPGACDTFYDPAFEDAEGPTLRSAYGSAAHANGGAAGAARDVTQMPEFASCAVQRIAGSFLGRPTTTDDDALVASLTQVFTREGYRVKPLVKAILKSDAYRRANNTSSAAWRAASPSTEQTPLAHPRGGAQ